MIMSDSPTPRNRAERRAAARKAQPHTPSSVDIPMALPDFTAKPQGKTLLEIAAERQAALSHGQPFHQDHAKSGLADDDLDVTTLDLSATYGETPFADAPLDPLSTGVLYASALSAIHATLDVIVLQQYRQDVLLKDVGWRLVTLFPALVVVVALLHVKVVKSGWVRHLRQVFFFVVSVAAGCYMVWAGNEEGYYHVMKKAPPLGTLWVWSVYELDVFGAVAQTAVVGGWMLWKGYGAF